MTTLRIEFTAGQRDALLWRLELGDCIAEVFADTQGLEHLSALAEERSRVLCRQLESQRSLDASDDELDREILCEAIAGSTYLAAHDPDSDTANTPQKFAAAKRCLNGAWERIAKAYSLPLDHLVLPEH